jgi:hypothetical protein
VRQTASRTSPIRFSIDLFIHLERAETEICIFQDDGQYKRTSITTMREQYLMFFTFLNSHHSHWSLGSQRDVVYLGPRVLAQMRGREAVAGPQPIGTAVHNYIFNLWSLPFKKGKIFQKILYPRIAVILLNAFQWT